MMVYVLLLCANVHYMPGQGERCEVKSAHRALFAAENKAAEICRNQASDCLNKTSIYPVYLRD